MNRLPQFAKPNLNLLKTGLGMAFMLVLPGLLFSRPQYAVRQKVSCSLCHVSPLGGGPRTIFGKVFGGRSILFPKTSQTDLYYGDVYVMGNYPTSNTTSKSSGAASLMSADAAINIPVIENESGSSLRAIAGYDISPNINGPRDIYALYN